MFGEVESTLTSTGESERGSTGKPALTDMNAGVPAVSWSDLDRKSWEPDAAVNKYRKIKIKSKT